MPTKFRLHAITVAIALFALTGCVTSRKTTTDRTPIERELISQSYARAVAQWPDLSPYAGQKFFLSLDTLDVPDQKYAENLLHDYLLSNGLVEVASAEEATLIVRPTAATAGIDDFQFLFGLPELAIGGGPFNFDTPEISLFKKDWQRGRTRLGGYAMNTDGTYAFELPTTGAEAKYIRHTFFLFFTWKWSDLQYPFSKKGKPEAKDDGEE
ncbi:MAG: hypothetical protein PWP23_3348 [Candidatus Sumerlaeota bacterium]|nr:hypothetical protein [Candidatus Sumerlaeota bacterium]